MENEFLNENVVKKTNTKNIIAMTAIIVLFLGLLFVTFSYFNSPKKRMVDGINKVFSMLTDKETNKKINNILNNDIIGLEGQTTINLNGNALDETFKLLDNTVIKYNYIEDKNNKKASLDFDSSIDNEKLITMYGLMKDNKMYFNLQNLINKYYHMEYEFTELLSIENTDDAEYVIDMLKEAMIESLDNDAFSKTKDTLKIDGESEKVEKISFEFTDKYLLDIISDFVKKVKEDERALKILVEYNNLTKEEIIETLDQAINSAENITSEQKYTFNMYVKDYIVTVKYELVMNTTEIAYYSYRDTKEFSISDNDIKYLNVEVKNDKDISGTLAMMIPFKGTYEDNKLELTFTYMTMDCNFVVDTDEEYKNDSYETNSKIELKVTEENEEYLNLVINSKNTISKLDKINELSIQSSTSVDEISENDQTIIINKLMENSVISRLITLLETQEMSSSSESSLEISGTEEYITF